MTPVRSGWVWLMSFIYFCFLMGMYGVTFWMPTIIKASGVKSVLHVGLLTAIPFTIGLIVMMLVSRSSDMRRERRLHCAIPSAICCVALICTVVYGSNTVLALVFISLAMAGSLTDLTHSTAAGMYMLSVFAFIGAALVLALVPAKMVNK